jgi:hypothetical protein
MAGRTSVRPPGQIQEKGLGSTAAGREVLTRCFEPSGYLLDAEEVRGSNPLAPTIKGPGHRAFFVWRSPRDCSSEAKKLTKS